MTIGVIGFSAQGAIGKQLAAWDLVPKTQTETELYFSDPAKLPTTYAPGKPITITTTAYNASNETKQYVYQIVQASDDPKTSKVFLHEENLTLQSGQTKQVHYTGNSGDTGGRANFSVQLKDNPQQINFWTTKK